MSETERNLRVAESLCNAYEWNGRSYREGQYVALLDGEVVAETDNPDDAIRTLRSLEPNPDRGMVVEIARPVVDIVR